MSILGRSILALALCLGLAGASTGESHAAGRSNLSTKTYEGRSRLSKAANGGAAYFFNRKSGLAASLGLKAIRSRNIKVTKSSIVHLGSQAGSAANITFHAETLRKINGAPAATTTVVVADRAVTGPSGGKARQARFFQRTSGAAGRVDVNPAL